MDMHCSLIFYSDFMSSHFFLVSLICLFVKKFLMELSNVEKYGLKYEWSSVEVTYFFNQDVMPGSSTYLRSMYTSTGFQ